MFYNMLASVADKTREVGIGEASLYALLGFAIVFAGIAFLILVVWAVGKCMEAVNCRTAKKRTPSVAPMEVKPAQREELTEETVAVITAAITAYYQVNNPKCEFTVKRIKRM